MLTLISPAKTLDYQTPLSSTSFSLPQFIDKAHALIKVCRQLSVDDLAKLMSISPNLAKLNHDRFQAWQTEFNFDNAKQAIFAFKGDVYEGIDVRDFTDHDLQFSQAHLRILSGLYGLLKPLDLMQPYRLEMGTRLKNGAHRNLYTFWGETLTDALNEELSQCDDATVINLASNEYFKAIKSDKLNAKIITPLFLEHRNGELKLISFYAKKARGLMSRFMIKNRIDNAQALKEFALEGYSFDKTLSTQNEWVFTRKH